MNWLKLLFDPEEGWRSIADAPGSWLRTTLTLLALCSIPSVAWYYGVTEVGWSVGSRDALRITPDSAMVIIALFYIAMVGGIGVIAALIYWMSVTYGSQATPIDSLRLAVYTAMPLFVAGVVGFFPVLWLDLLIGIAAAGWAIVLLYTGIPIVMQIPKERGYLFSSAAVAVCLVLLIGLMGVTVSLWEWGAMPVFTD